MMRLIVFFKSASIYFVDLGMLKLPKLFHYLTFVILFISSNFLFYTKAWCTSLIKGWNNNFFFTVDSCKKATKVFNGKLSIIYCKGVVFLCTHISANKFKYCKK